MANSGILHAKDTNQACLVRYWTDADDGELVVWVRNTSNSDTSSVNVGYGSSYAHLIVQVGSGGNVKYFDGSAYQTLQAYTANTWIKITLNWDKVLHSSQWRMKVNDSAYTSWMSGNGSFTVLNRITLCGRSSGDTYFDDISNMYVAPEAVATTTATTTTTTTESVNFGLAIIIVFLSFGFTWVVYNSMSTEPKKM